MERVKLDAPRLSQASRDFALRLFTWRPALEGFASMEMEPKSDRASFLVEMPSPTGDPERQLRIWMEKDVPSIEFGPWHTHANLWGKTGTDALIDLLGAITNDEFVQVIEVGGEYEGRVGVVDLRDQDALAEELTSEYSSGRIRIRSWTGSADREVGLEDLEGFGS